MSAREIRDQEGHCTRDVCLNKLLTLMRTFRLAHCRRIRFAPSRVRRDCTLESKAEDGSTNLQIHHSFQ